MVQWFNPVLLAKLGWQVIVSALFGQYADQRVSQAALDDANDATLLSRYDLQKEMEADEDGAYWFDYVSDLGEGFDSTYAMATLLARDSIDIEGAKPIPRGQFLIMGGDEVYPTASRDEYQLRMRDPYEMAYPNDTKRGAKHPKLFVIPGNHDWYDGLDAFHSIFCRALDRAPHHGGLSVGNWRCKQHRSYFAIQLPDNWWIWGLDIQLKGYVDQPQVNYFRLIAQEKLKEKGAKIIICTAQPSWLKAEHPGDIEYKSLNYITDIAKGAQGKPTVCALLAGDVHHYSRYSAEGLGIQFVTAGGGGAFLHPTHQLKDNLVANWSGENCNLKLETDPAVDHEATEKKACYPDVDTSRRLLKGNLSFVKTNWDFALGLGGLYWLLSYFFVVGKGTDLIDKWGAEANWNFGDICILATRMFWKAIVSPSFVILLLALLAIFVMYADTNNKGLKIPIGILHGLCQCTAMLASAFLFQILNIGVLGWEIGTHGFFWAYLAEMVLFAGFMGGFVWGIYLIIACGLFGIHTNEGFSAMQINRYRNFLRIRIKGDELTIYPIGLEKVPAREDWQSDLETKSNLEDALFHPTVPLAPHLIEGPVIVKTADINQTYKTATT